LVFVSYRLILMMSRKFDEEHHLKENKVSVGVILGSMLLGEAIILKQAIYPVMAVIQLFILGGDRGVGRFFSTVGLAFGFVVVVGILAVFTVSFCFWLFNHLTPQIDQYEEIKKGNLAVAVLMAFFIIGICLLLSEGISGLVKALVPFPEIGSIPLK
ncbi:MAG: DUF350 domain-containing protein, partial [Candidatus Aminicenantes bacterium]|nr:DUF350 domain-containing protein [Candidatus Aminicenantes bacterium]